MVARYRPEPEIKATQLYVVYWLYDDTCSVPENDGYVGVSHKFPVRLKAHQKYGKFPSGFKHMILLTGVERDCYEKEAEYRPRPGMGWNKYSGGKIGCIPHPQTIKKQAKARKRWWKGRKNRKASDETRAKMRAGQKLRPAPTPEWIEGQSKRMVGNKIGLGNINTKGKKLGPRDPSVGAAISLRMQGNRNSRGKKHKPRTPEQNARNKAAQIKHRDKVCREKELVMAGWSQGLM